ncbi:MAG: glycosyltransferase family 2 protein [Pseudomonadota bacterium]|nr:glycosyltransferase family 2 protein [Pseudomonadota bacterium]
MIRPAAKALANRVFPPRALHQLRWWRARLQALRAGLGARSTPRPHELGGKLLVSLTSYPARFETLPLTLRSLLRQNLHADEVILWIAHGDLALLPRQVRDLESAGLSIRGCDDLRSYKKLIFALAENPGAFIVTADDDIFYPPTWLERLVEAFDPAQPAITCMRAHRLRSGADGSLAPYQSWGWEVRDEASSRASVDILPTGNGGILYPPQSLHPDVLDREAFLQLAPTADDLWFYWMGRRAGSRYKVADTSFRLIAWPYPEDQTLAGQNIEGGNDRQIRALEARYGNPMMMNGGTQ